MRSLPRSHLSISRLRRWSLILVLIAGYLMGAVGFPLPAHFAKDKSRPFPCQDHACGCQNADQCWHHCCCYSTEQKLQWAAAHRVEPPPELRSQVAALGWRSTRLRDQNRTGATCACAAEPQQKKCCQTADSKPTQPDKTASPWVIAVMAHQCQGRAGWCQAVFVALPPPAVITWNFDWRPVDYLPKCQLSLHHTSTVPPTPPPRYLSASV